MTIKVSLLFVLIVLCCCSNGRSRNELKVLDDSNTEVNGKDLGSMGLDYSVDVLDDDSLAIIHRYLQEDGQERIFYQEMVGGMFQLYSKIYHGSEKPTRIFTEYHRYDEEDYYLDGVEVPYMYAISLIRKAFMLLQTCWLIVMDG